MSEVHVTVTPSQRDFLVRMLSDALRGKLIEERRTSYSIEFRHDLESEEEQIQALIDKFTEAAETV